MSSDVSIADARIRTNIGKGDRFLQTSRFHSNKIGVIYFSIADTSDRHAAYGCISGINIQVGLDHQQGAVDEANHWIVSI